VEPVLTPLPGRPALRLGAKGSSGPASVIVADLHLGLGGNRDRPGGPPQGNSGRLLEDLLAATRAARASRLIVAGDVKHPILGTPPPLRPVVFDFFGGLLEQGLDVEIVLGNHDVGLVRWLPREVTVHPAKGIVRHGVGIFHGHRWPSDAVLRAPRIVTGHLHPGYRLAPTAEDPAGKRRCWVRSALPPPAPVPRRKRRHAPLRAREIVVLPAFNPIAGTEALNRERPKRGRSFLWHRFLARGEARAYLLDGTDLGVLPT
jgi:uncharacterized protein